MCSLEHFGRVELCFFLIAFVFRLGDTVGGDSQVLRVKGQRSEVKVGQDSRKVGVKDMKNSYDVAWRCVIGRDHLETSTVS